MTLNYKYTISSKFNTVRDMTTANNKPYTFMCATDELNNSRDTLRFPHKTVLGSSLPPGQLLVGGLVSYLRYLCLLAYNGVQLLLCYVLLLLLLSTSCFLCMVVYNIYCIFILVYLRLVYPMLPVSLDCPFLITTSALMFIDRMRIF